MYAGLVKIHAKALRATHLSLTATARNAIASHLDALAWIAENHPHVFAELPTPSLSPSGES